jgi:acyl carrier protein
VNESQILASLTTIIRDVLDQPNLHLTLETTADQTEGWDSFNYINIIVTTEQEFGIKFKTAEIEMLRNVGELVALVEQKLRTRR